MCNEITLSIEMVVTPGLLSNSMSMPDFALQRMWMSTCELKLYYYAVLGTHPNWTRNAHRII